MYEMFGNIRCSYEINIFFNNFNKLQGGNWQLQTRRDYLRFKEWQETQIIYFQFPWNLRNTENVLIYGKID